MTFSASTIRAVQIAQALAKETQHAAVSPPHLLKGLLHNDVGLASWVAALGKDVHFLRDWADYRIELLPRSGKWSRIHPAISRRRPLSNWPT